MSSTTFLATIQSLHNMFACFGLPEQVITDNVRNFVSEKFKEFLHGIKHTTSATYRPSTNGLAEHTVQTFKQVLTKLKERIINEHIYLDFCSTTYRITPQSRTETSPAELETLDMVPDGYLDC